MSPSRSLSKKSSQISAGGGTSVSVVSSATSGVIPPTSVVASASAPVVVSSVTSGVGVVSGAVDVSSSAVSLPASTLPPVQRQSISVPPKHVCVPNWPSSHWQGCVVPSVQGGSPSAVELPHPTAPNAASANPATRPVVRRFTSAILNCIVLFLVIQKGAKGALTLRAFTIAHQFRPWRKPRPPPGWCRVTRRARDRHRPRAAWPRCLSRRLCSRRRARRRHGRRG